MADESLDEVFHDILPNYVSYQSNVNVNHNDDGDEMNDSKENESETLDSVLNDILGLGWKNKSNINNNSNKNNNKNVDVDYDNVNNGKSGIITNNGLKEKEKEKEKETKIESIEDTLKNVVKPLKDRELEVLLQFKFIQVNWEQFYPKICNQDNKYVCPACQRKSLFFK